MFCYTYLIKINISYFCFVNRNLLTYLVFAFGLFSLLLTGESVLHSQKTANLGYNVSSEYANDYVVSQHQLKAISVIKEANLTKANIPIALIGSIVAYPFSKWGFLKTNLSGLFQQSRFVPDKRKSISLLLYPYHYFW